MTQYEPNYDLLKYVEECKGFSEITTRTIFL